MVDFDTMMGCCLALIAMMFIIPVHPRFAKNFYPQSPATGVRLVAPSIFLAMSAACFAGIGFEVFAFVAIIGSAIIIRGWFRKPAGVASPV